MKTKSKFIIISSMACIMISIVALAFSYAWFQLPYYSTLQLGVGAASLFIKNTTYVRRQAADNSSMLGNVVGTDYNVKKTTKVGTTVNNGTQSSDPNTGTLTVTFNNLTYNLFGNSNTDLGSVGGLFDPATGSMNVDYLSFAFVELIFYNLFFPSFVKANYTLSVTSQGIDEALFTDLFNVKMVDDVVGDNDNADNPNYAKDGLRQKFLDDMYLTSADPYGKANMKKLVDYGSGPNDPDINFHSVTLDTPTDIFLSHFDNTGVANVDTDQIMINSNPNSKKDSNNFDNDVYSYACGLAFSIDPIKLYDIFKAHRESNKAIDMTFDATITINFSSANAAFFKEGAVNL